MLRFFSSEDGTTAVIFALALVPILASAGVAVDYGRVMEFREFARQRSDTAALAVASAEAMTDGAGAIEAAKVAITSKYGSAVRDVEIAGSWIDLANYRLTVGASMKNVILAAVPGMPSTTRVEVETVVNMIPATVKAFLPTIAQLSPEAADYNRVYMYCFDPDEAGEANKGRTNFVAIADNADAGTSRKYAKDHPDLKLNYAENQPPTCGAGEMISYMLRNVRNARTTTSQWDNKNVTSYEYYTDTEFTVGNRVLTNNMSGQKIEKNKAPVPIDMNKNPMLETILCDTKAECLPKNEGGILPNNHETGRKPKVATAGCTEGKFMYYGWEDRRPDPTTGDGSDTDYDDIRLVIGCPQIQKATEKMVRIVK